MPTMNINLTPELAKFVASELAGGDYASNSEIVRDALRMMRRDRDRDAEMTARLQHEIDIGVAQAERGEFSDMTVMEIAALVLVEGELAGGP